MRPPDEYAAIEARLDAQLAPVGREAPPPMVQAEAEAAQMLSSGRYRHALALLRAAPDRGLVAVPPGCTAAERALFLDGARAMWQMFEVMAERGVRTDG